MTTRICPTCGSFVPVSNLRCHECKQLLPSMLQLAHDSEEPRSMRMPGSPGTGPLKSRQPEELQLSGTGKLARIFQSFARK